MSFNGRIAEEAWKTGWDAWLGLPSFSHLVAIRAHESPDTVGYSYVLDGEDDFVNLTYGDLDRQSRSIATHLQGLGAPGDRAILVYPPGLEFITAFFGCLYAGMVAVPVPPPIGSKSAGRMKQIWSDCRPTFVMGTDEVLEPLREAVGPNHFHWLAHETLLETGHGWNAPSLAPDTLAFLQYTSGSTSAPRGVMISHGTMLANIGATVCGLAVGGADHYVSWLPHFHDMGLAQGLLIPLYAGCPATLMGPHHFIQKPSRWLSTLSAVRGTHGGAPNFAYELCNRKVSSADLKGLDLSALRVLLNGAEPIRPATVETFIAKLEPVGLRREVVTAAYGLAETTVAVALERPGAVYREAPGPVANASDNGGTGSAKTFVGCGPPLPGLEAVVVDPDTFVPVPDGALGEIWLSGTSVSPGYWEKPAATAETFGGKIAGGDGCSYLRTGDLGFMKDGDIYVAGRLKDILVVHGRNHYPQDIELTVETAHGGIRPGCVAAFSVEVDNEERVVVVCEVAKSALGSTPEFDAICSALRTAVSQDHDLALHGIALIEPGTISKTSSGKIQRHRSRQCYLDGTLKVIHTREFVGDRPGGESVALVRQPLPSFQFIRQFLTECVADRLGVALADIDGQAPFNSYGLGSLALVEISTLLQEKLGRPLSPSLAYSYPTIDALSRHLCGDTAVRRGDSQRQAGEPLAIVGMACRFPGAPNLDAFWSLLTEGREAICDVPTWRWDPDYYHDPEMSAPFRMRTRRGGFLDEIRDFDAAFFGISPREAAMMDPQQRLVLEVAWEALEHGAISPTSLAGTSTGVFVGVGPVDYVGLTLNYNADMDAYCATGNSSSIVSNRLSYLLDLHGPSTSIDTACSSSLVALHQACQSLRNGECDKAIVSAVNAILSPMPFFVLSAASMLSPDGRCKAFDANADGYVRSEGCGTVIVKRLADAEADGDRILAVIRGTAVNHVGRSNGLTAPSSRAQQAVIEAALADGNVAAADIDYIEAHGTGTSLGDPIEMEALRNVLLPNRPQERPCWVGSVKTNVGHLETAAGMAGLIKTVLAMNHGIIPPHLHVNELNPLLEIEGTAIAIPSTSQPWRAGNRTRLAGVSAFGFGGANAHVVLQHHGEHVSENPMASVGEPNLLTLSAKSADSLRRLAAEYAGTLKATAVSVRDLCQTANMGRAHHAFRAAVVGRSATDMSAALQALASGEKPSAVRQGRITSAETEPRVAMLFTGQGAQYPNMGREIYENDPEFRRTIEFCSEYLAGDLEHRLVDVLYGEHNECLGQTAYTQPALFALEYGLAKLWRDRGVEPVAVLGHSVGEYAAACVAGAFSLEDGLKLIAARGRLIQSLPAGGAMAAIFALRDDVEQWLMAYAGRIVVATVNAPDLVVVSGEGAALDEFLSRLSERGIRTSRLDVSHAFHSPLMDSVLDEFETVARTVTYRPLEMPLASNLTGTLLPAGHTFDSSYWRRHIREAVLFERGMSALDAIGCTCYLEVGPANTLLAMGKRALPLTEAAWLPSLSAKRSDEEVVLETTAECYVSGVPIRWNALYSDGRRNVVTLPTYPFERKRHWITPQHSGFVWHNAEGVPPLTGTENGVATSGTGEVAPLYTLEWRSVAADGLPQATSGGSVAVFVDSEGALDGFVSACEAAGTNVTTIRIGNRYEEHATGVTLRPHESADLIKCVAFLGRMAPHAIVYGWSLSSRHRTPHEDLAGALAIASQVYQQFASALPSPFWWVTERAIAQRSGASVDPAQASIVGLFRAAQLEYPDPPGGLIDLDNLSSAPWTDILGLVRSGAPERQWIYRSAEGWYIPRLVKPDLSANAPVRFRTDATYLVTGGFGALGVQTAEWLIARGARHLLLLGRTTPPRRSDWGNIAPGDPRRRTIDVVQQLEGRGASVRWAALDIADENALKVVLNDQTREGHPPIRGVFHLAGVLDDKSLASLDRDSFERVLSPKARGAWNLHAAFRSEELDWFVLYSSAASMLGSAGQGNYGAANAYLDGLAAYRASLGLPACTINWGPWAGDGMAEGDNRGGRMSRQGIHLLESGPALNALALAMGGPKGFQAGVFSMDWRRLSEQFGAVTDGLLAEVLSEGPVGPGGHSDISAFLEAESDTRRQLILDYVRERIAVALGVEPSQIDMELGLVNQGLDSIMMLDIVRVIGRDLNLRIHVRELFDQANVRAFADYVSNELDMYQGRSRGRTAPKQGFLAAYYEAIGLFEKTFRPPATRNPPCVFLLSAPRSGSTLLRVMLSGHHGLFSPPELHLLHFEKMSERGKLFGQGQELGAGLPRALMELNGIDADEADALIQRMTEEETPIQDVYRLLQNGAAPRLLVDKSPSYAGRAETLYRAEQMFQDAKYIFLHRHPYSVIESYMRNRTGRMFEFNNADPFHFAEEVWTLSNANIRTFQEKVDPDRFITICYEEMVKQPETYAEQLCSFLGLPFEASVLSPYDQGKMVDGARDRDRMIGDPNFLQHEGIDARLAEVWRTIELPGLLGETAQAEARALGYELPREWGDAASVIDGLSDELEDLRL